MKLTILDYGVGNLESLFNACKKTSNIKIDINVSSNPKDLTTTDSAILPGVGAFGHAMELLELNGWINYINDYINSNRPILGICLGMQILFSKSSEFGAHNGLNFIKGEVEKLPECEEKCPNVGWRQLIKDHESPMFDGIDHKSYFYFTHSYFCKPLDNKIINSSIEFCGEDITSSIHNKNIWATQFHPEKSAEAGLTLLRNFINF